MIKRLQILILFLLIIPLTTFPVFAQSDYVLPYPSSMPGNVFYKVNLVKEKLMKYWYFGSFGKFDYNLKQSDKYLVEAKTLFEYKQYLLGFKALQKSNTYFNNIPQYLTKAKRENKNIVQRQNILKSASLKHIEMLNFIETITPDNFVWNPEKEVSTDLNLEKTIDEAIRIRKNNIQTI